MTIDRSKVREFPPISITINGDDGGELLIGATRQAVTGASETEVRRELLGLVVAHARTGGSVVRVTTRDQEGIGVLLVSPEGEIEEEYSEAIEVPEPVPAGAVAELGEDEPVRAPVHPGPPARPTTAPEAREEDIDRLLKEIDQLPPLGTEPEPRNAPAGLPSIPAARAEQAEEATQTRRSLREAESFLRAPAVVEPARTGLRGLLNSLGLSLPPGALELEIREFEHLVARHYAMTRTIAVVNQKGGSNKTPSVACLSAVFGLAGGSVLAWDNNETTGTLGWRTEQGDHTRSALDVLSRSAHLLSDTARAADINAFVHHQTADKYDVLRSDADIDGTHEVTADEVDVLHAVASKYYNLVFMDSGNNHRAANWNRMIEHADQLVVPTTTEEDRAEAALLTLKGLARRDERTAQLAAQAVVVVSQWQPGQEKLAAQIADGFREYVRDVQVIPFDPALKAGIIHHGAMRPKTRLAWLRAAAAVAKGL
jgi:MinD-like ATPase involved in chromosome partitioning or flagellar assembly